VTQYLWLIPVCGSGWVTYRMFARRWPGLRAELSAAAVMAATAVIIGASS